MNGYVILSESWYGKQILNDEKIVDQIQIVIGCEENEGGCEYELSMSFIDLRNLIAPKLEIFGDAFSFFIEFEDLMKDIGYLSECNFIGVGEVIEVLEKHNFKDITQRNKYKV